MNRLTQTCVVSLTETLHGLRREACTLVIAGNSHFFSVGANLEEIATLKGPAAYQFCRLGQGLMAAIENFPAPVYAAISGYCMGGGLDLALSCHRRIASPNALFGHRGAALGLITGWGGNAAAAAIDREGASTGNVRCCRESKRGAGASHGFD